MLQRSRTPFRTFSSIAEIISQATVSHELNEALEKALRASEYLNEYLADAIKDLDVDIDNYSSFTRSGIDEAKIDRVHSVYVTSVNVLEQHESTFTCEPEIEAEIELEINVGVIEEDYLGRRRRGFSTSQIRTLDLYPELSFALTDQQANWTSSQYP